MKKLLMLVLIVLIVSILCLLQDTIVTGNKVEENCACSIIIECYYPGYVPGDLRFASQTVNSCAKAQEYMEYISQTSGEVFFYLHSES